MRLRSRRGPESRITRIQFGLGDSSSIQSRQPKLRKGVGLGRSRALAQNQHLIDHQARDRAPAQALQGTDRLVQAEKAVGLTGAGDHRRK